MFLAVFRVSFFMNNVLGSIDNDGYISLGFDVAFIGGSYSIEDHKILWETTWILIWLESRTTISTEFPILIIGNMSGNRSFRIYIILYYSSLDFYWQDCGDDYRIFCNKQLKNLTMKKSLKTMTFISLQKTVSVALRLFNYIYYV